MEVWIRKSQINGPLSIAIFEYRRVGLGFAIRSLTAEPGRVGDQLGRQFLIELLHVKHDLSILRTTITLW